jgi:hypothetical protein
MRNSARKNTIDIKVDELGFRWPRAGRTADLNGPDDCTIPMQMRVR